MRLKVKDNLFEEWGNLNAVSSDVLNNYRVKNLRRNMGRNSDVEIIKNGLTYPHLWNKIYKEGLFAVLRYNQDDLFLFLGEDIIQLISYEDLIDGLNYSDRPKLQRSIKSESGFQRFIMAIVKFLMTAYNKKKDEILSRMDIQIVYPDTQRNIKSSQRHTLRNKNDDVVHNGHVTPPNSELNTKNLYIRLKNYLENKLTDFKSDKDLPRDLVFLNKNTKFKFMGTPFIFGGAVYNSKMDNFLSGEPIYYYFYNEKFYGSNAHINSIIYELILDGSTLKVDNIYFSEDRTPSKNDLKTLDEILK